jgi:hypothetical protein
MRVAAGIIVVLVVLFFTVPMVVGGSADSCQALEKHNVSNTASSVAGGSSGPVYGVINTVGQAGATGQGQAAKQSVDHPNLPSGVGCTVAFWQSL